MKPAPSLKGRSWSAEDDERLKSLIEAGVSIHLVAAKMKRTIQAVKWRANARGISIKRVGPRRPAVAAPVRYFGLEAWDRRPACGLSVARARLCRVCV
jgi:hypothetical protein